MSFPKELDIALEAVSRAGAYLRHAYEEFTAIPNARADITTEADRQSQEIILQTIHAAFPADALCAEEQTPTATAAPRTGSRLWVVDPIDGTRGFAQKNGEFSVMVGFVQDGEIALGVVLEPALGRLTYAVRGAGCFRKDGDAPAAEPCRVTTCPTLEESTLTQSHSRHPQEPTRQVRLLKPGRVRETHSAGVKLVLVARGEADLYVNYYPNFHDWDICAGHILVTEAGGTVTGMLGETIRYGLPGAPQRHGLLASNGRLHEAALERLRAGDHEKRS